MSTPKSVFIEHADCGYVRTEGGNVFTAECTAYAKWGDLLGLSIVGTATALDAIRANVSIGRPLALVRNSQSFYDRDITLSADRGGYHTFKTSLPEIRQHHLVIINNKVTTPALDEYYYYMLAKKGERPSDILGRCLRQHLPIAVLPSWTPYLYEQASEHKRVRRLDESNVSGFMVLIVDKEPKFWQETISKGLQSKRIQFEGV